MKLQEVGNVRRRRSYSSGESERRWAWTCKCECECGLAACSGSWTRLLRLGSHESGHTAHVDWGATWTSEPRGLGGPSCTTPSLLAIPFLLPGSVLLDLKFDGVIYLCFVHGVNYT